MRPQLELGNPGDGRLRCHPRRFSSLTRVAHIFIQIILRSPSTGFVLLEVALGTLRRKLAHRGLCANQWQAQQYLHCYTTAAFHLGLARCAHVLGSFGLRLGLLLPLALLLLQARRAASSSVALLPRTRTARSVPSHAISAGVSSRRSMWKSLKRRRGCGEN